MIEIGHSFRIQNISEEEELRFVERFDIQILIGTSVCASVPYFDVFGGFRLSNEESSLVVDYFTTKTVERRNSVVLQNSHGDRFGR